MSKHIFILVCAFLIFMYIYSCNIKKNIRFEETCDFIRIDELDSTFYRTDTVFLFKEICSQDNVISDFCEDFPNQNLSTLLHPGFVEISSGLSIKQCYSKNYYCIANGTAIMTYRRYKGMSINLSKREIDSIRFLNSKIFSRNRILSDSFIFFCDKKFNRINNRPKYDCLRMQGGKFIITYLPAPKKCYLFFRNPDKHLRVDKVLTNINFIVDLKEIQENK